MDRPPEGLEAEIFTWREASMWDEHWVPLDLPRAQKTYRQLWRALEQLPKVMQPLP